jgi:hypothetical protein
MSRLVRCDRCHSEVDPDGANYAAVTVPPANVGDSQKVVDLCVRCLRQLREWVGPQAIAAEGRR